MDLLIKVNLKSSGPNSPSKGWIPIGIKEVKLIFKKMALRPNSNIVSFELRSPYSAYISWSELIELFDLTSSPESSGPEPIIYRLLESHIKNKMVLGDENSETRDPSFAESLTLSLISTYWPYYQELVRTIMGVGLFTDVRNAMK